MEDGRKQKGKDEWIGISITKITTVLSTTITTATTIGVRATITTTVYTKSL